MIEIPGYTVIRLLGHGGMATVYLAQQLSLRREVALKILTPALASDPVATERFLREARVSAKLHHPNIVAIFDVGVHEGVPYMSIAYEPGGTVAGYTQARNDPKVALRIIRDIANALDYAHRQGVIHRDVKPENILLRHDGTCVLSDFGIAHAVEAQTGLTREGTSVGTPHYMSPEQLRGEHVDARADIYSLGVVMFQLLVGELPYQGTDGWAIGMQHISAPIPHLPPHLDYLQTFLDALLAKDPTRRLQSGAEVVQWVDARLSGSGPALTVAMPMTPMPSYAQQTPPGARGAASLAILPFADLSQTKDQEYLADGLTEELLNLLAKTPGLFVASRSSAQRFKGSTAKLAEIGRELKVATVLEGSVRKFGERVRISVQLINVADGFQRWSETYDRTMTDVFAIQDEIAALVVIALKEQLLPNVEAEAAKKAALLADEKAAAEQREREAAELKQREETDKAAAEEQRQREIGERILAKKREREEAERLAAEKKQREEEERAAEAIRQREEEARRKVEEAQRKQEEARAEAERKQREEQARVEEAARQRAEEERTAAERAAAASAAAQRAEADRLAAEQRQRDDEARAAADAKRLEEEARQARERQQREDAELAEALRRKREGEERAAAEKAAADKAAAEKAAAERAAAEKAAAEKAAAAAEKAAADKAAAERAAAERASAERAAADKAAAERAAADEQRRRDETERAALASAASAAASAAASTPPPPSAPATADVPVEESARDPAREFASAYMAKPAPGTAPPPKVERAPSNPSPFTPARIGIAVGALLVLAVGGWLLMQNLQQKNQVACQAALLQGQGFADAGEYDKAAESALSAHGVCKGESEALVATLEERIRGGKAMVATCGAATTRARELLRAGQPKAAAEAMAPARDQCAGYAGFPELEAMPAAAQTQAAALVLQASALLKSGSATEAQALAEQAFAMDAEAADLAELRKQLAKRLGTAPPASATAPASAPAPTPAPVPAAPPPATRPTPAPADAAATAAAAAAAKKAAEDRARKLAEERARKAAEAKARADADAAARAQPAPPLPPPVAPAPASTPPASSGRGTALVATSTPQPPYPPAALRAKVSGEVTVAFTVNTDGSVGKVRIVSAKPRGVFDRGVMNAVGRWRFQPIDEPQSAQRTITFQP